MECQRNQTISSVVILLPGEQIKLKTENYLVSNLKIMCKHYGIKHDRVKKEELISNLFYFLFRSKSAQTIQKAIRKKMLTKYIKAKGPAHIKRTLCVNETDFYTMDKVSYIEYEQFISFTDKDGMIYGFDIMSLQNLLTKGAKPYKNPYNRNELPKELLDNINILIKLSGIYFKKINIFQVELLAINKIKLQELKCLSLFQEINKLGNYTDHMWFWSLNKPGIIRFVRELLDIWSYRANLDIATKKLISPPSGNPFASIINHSLQSMNLNKLRETGLTLIHSLTLTATDDSMKALGANYVLCALTLVNPDAATSLPWLYHSVSSY